MEAGPGPPKLPVSAEFPDELHLSENHVDHPYIFAGQVVTRESFSLPFHNPHHATLNPTTK